MASTNETPPLDLAEQHEIELNVLRLKVDAAYNAMEKVVKHTDKNGRAAYYNSNGKAESDMNDPNVVLAENPMDLPQLIALSIKRINNDSENSVISEIIAKFAKGYEEKKRIEREQKEKASAQQVAEYSYLKALDENEADITDIVFGIRFMEDIDIHKPVIQVVSFNKKQKTADVIGTQEL